MKQQFIRKDGLLDIVAITDRIENINIFVVDVIGSKRSIGCKLRRQMDNLDCHRKKQVWEYKPPFELALHGCIFNYCISTKFLNIVF